MRIFGYIPSRMGSTRLPGKALKKINKKTLTEHVYSNMLRFKKWNSLEVAICDQEIKDLLISKKIPYVMTSKNHVRCLDRVCEAVQKNKRISKKDIIVCIQGDEIMVSANMIKKLLIPFNNPKCNSTILTMKIKEISEYKDKNVVKIITNNNGKVLIGSRSQLPHMSKFRKGIAKKIIGVYAFRLRALTKFKNTKQTYLEKIESCDTNRICETTSDMYAVDYPYKKIIAIDTIQDLKKVRNIFSKI